MNLSLTNRVKITFIIANAVVLITGFLMYFFLESLSDQTKNIWDDMQTVRQIDEFARGNITDLTSRGIRFGEKKASSEKLTEYKDVVNVLRGNIERLKTEYKEDEVKKLLQNVLGSVNKLEGYIGDPESEETGDRFKDSSYHLSLTGEISESFSKYLKKSQLNSADSGVRVKNIIASVKKNMLLVLILAFLGTIILSWLIPHKVALPFKKINHAIRELQDCNFDVSIAYDEVDEIGELSSELNKMIAQLKLHEELRSDKFILESKKFNIIANYLDESILVANSDGKLSYMNNDMYAKLRLETSDVIDKELEGTSIPESIVNVFQKALKRRGKIENEEVKFSYKANGEEGSEEVERDFSGYAEVYPIRGKESSLDYYLMVISQEMST